MNASASATPAWLAAYAQERCLIADDIAEGAQMADLDGLTIAQQIDVLVHRNGTADTFNLLYALSH